MILYEEKQTKYFKCLKYSGNAHWNSFVFGHLDRKIGDRFECLPMPYNEANWKS